MKEHYSAIALQRKKYKQITKCNNISDIESEQITIQNKHEFSFWIPLKSG